MNPRTTTILTAIGFFLLIFGMMSIVLSLTGGLTITFMDWIPAAIGRGGAFLVHICMVIFGIVLTVAVRSGNFAGEDPVRDEPLDTPL